MENIHFLYGDDSYRIQNLLSDLLPSGGSGYDKTIMDASDTWDMGRFENELVALGFFSNNRVVVVKDMLSSKDVDGEKVIALLQKTSLDITVIIVEQGLPDKRTKLYKWLVKNAQAQELIRLRGSDWSQFASGLISQSNVKLSSPMRSALVSGTVGDGWQLKNVLSQLELWLDGSATEQKDMDYFLPRRFDGNSFGLLDALVGNDSAKAVRHILDLWQQDEAPIRVLGAIVYQYRQLVTIKALLDADTPQSMLAREARIPPFVVSKLTSIARKFSWDWFGTVYNHITQIDEAIKNGKLEPRESIELLVYNLSKMHAGDQVPKVIPVLA